MHHTDFELELYLRELITEVDSLAYTNEFGASKENTFTEVVMELLAEAGETEGVRLCPYEKENQFENIQTKLNGYAIDEGFETLDLFVSHFRDSAELFRVGKADFDKLIKWPLSFLEQSLNGLYQKTEPSSEAHGLARFIHENVEKFVRINIFILSNGQIPHDPGKNNLIKGLEDKALNIHVWDIGRLHRLFQSKYSREPIEIDFEDTLGETIPCLPMPSANDIYECYLAIIPGKVLAALYKNFGIRLLESNVRAFLQQTGKINRGIRDTILTSPEMFLPYNNGLAATAQDVKTKTLENGQLVITGVRDFQIVNGGQTTASLFHTERKFKADISRVFVQMKLTIIRDEDKKNRAIPLISRYSNSQNKVSELDLSSNSHFLRRLEELSRTTYATDPENNNRQTVWFFERVKGQYKEAINREETKGKKDAFKIKYPSSQVVSKSEVAKYINTWHRRPFDVAKGAQKNYNYFLRNVETEFEDKLPDRIYWKDVVANAILFKTVDKLFGRKNSNAVGDTNIKATTVTYTLAYINHITANRLNLSQIWEKQVVPDDLKTEFLKGLSFVYSFLKNLDVALISEAAKSEITWKKLSEIAEHPMDMEVIDNYLMSKAAIKEKYNSHEDKDSVLINERNRTAIESLGVRFWDGLAIYNSGEKILNEYLLAVVWNIRRKLKQSGELNEKELKGGVEILEITKSLGLKSSSVVAMSKIDEVDQSYQERLCVKIGGLNNVELEKILSFGSRTQILVEEEIQVVEAVFQKLKRGEKPDLERLKIVDVALKKIQKYQKNSIRI